MLPCTLPRSAFPLALACAAALAERAPAAPCPNYPYPSISDLCVGDGFCGLVEPEAQASGTYVEPGLLESESADPLAFSHGATAGSGDNSAIVEASVGAGLSSIDVEASVDVTAPIGPALVSATGNARTITVLRATDLVFSGPGPAVETSFRFTLDGSFAFTTLEGKGDDSSATALTLLGGAICGGQVFVEFDGYLQVTENARAGMSPLRNVTATELLEGVDLDAVTEFSRGPFSVPTGVPLQLELWMESGAGALTTGGDGSSTLELTALLGPAGGGDIFDLPAGYSADSEQAGIAGNRIVPVPESGAPAAVTVLALAALARRGRLERRARASSRGRVQGVPPARRDLDLSPNLV
jgi:hypothetical protein